MEAAWGWEEGMGKSSWNRLWILYELVDVASCTWHKSWVPVSSSLQASVIFTWKIGSIIPIMRYLVKFKWGYKCKSLISNLAINNLNLLSFSINNDKTQILSMVWIENLLRVSKSSRKSNSDFKKQTFSSPQICEWMHCYYRSSGAKIYTVSSFLLLCLQLSQPEHSRDHL